MAETAAGSTIQRGVQQLRRCFGDAALYLEETKTAGSEAAAFYIALPPDYLGIKRRLRIGFPTAFPYLPMDFSITPSPRVDWPHCMEDGLCLYTDGEQPVTSTPEAAVDEAIEKAFALIRFSLAEADQGRRDAEFAREIRSYWMMQQAVTPYRLTLVGVPTCSGPLYVVSDRSDLQRRNFRYIAASHYEEISSFEQRFDRRALPQRSTAKAGFFARLNSSPPPRLPTADFITWLIPHLVEEDIPAFMQWTKESADLASRWLVVSLPVEGLALHTFHLRSLEIDRGRARVYGRRAVRRASIRASNRRYAAEFTPTDVMDPTVIHHRAGPGVQALMGKRAVLVGAGSLGGEIAVLLARSGVGRLTLVDADRFEDVNIGRHVLGTQALGEVKVHALRSRILRDVPSVSVTAIPCPVQAGGAALKSELEKADVVIVTTANWPSEEYLWSLKSAGANWSLIHAWSEPHGFVGHALLAPSGSYDARGLFDRGRFTSRFSNWPNNGVYALPACGASYIPGAPVALARIAGMTAQLALATLTGQSANPRWHSTVGNLGQLLEHGGFYEGPSLPEGANFLEREMPWPEAVV
ncbi:ThiF family adenylyltransferase [Luteibacter sp. PPL552]